jgi:hypothetical protein
MKIIQFKKLVERGAFPRSIEWGAIEQEIRESILKVEWPKGSGEFILYDQSGKKRGEGSGVKPIKDACMANLEKLGWELESKPDRFDAARTVGQRLFVVEWQTGNISSSHRAMNKMARGLLDQSLVGGILILPTRSMYYYLTDRVGNFKELEPYFPVWSAIPIQEGILGVIAIEHDRVSWDVPRIPKGTDGRAIE